MKFDTQNFKLAPASAIDGSVSYTFDGKNPEIQRDEFLGFASHELKTPVTSIKAYVQFMERCAANGIDKPAVSLLPYIQKVDAQIDKLTQIINDLLDVTKVQAGKLEFTNEHFKIDELLNEVIDSMQLLAVKHTIKKTGSTDACIYADRERTSQVLINILSNAITYSPRAKEINVSIVTKENIVTIAVQDFGVGIAKGNQEKIFEKYYRVERERKETYPGMGLGLYIASEIIKRQNGKLFLTSEEGKGSTFFVELPLVIK